MCALYVRTTPPQGDRTLACAQLACLLSITLGLLSPLMSLSVALSLATGVPAAPWLGLLV